MGLFQIKLQRKPNWVKLKRDIKGRPDFSLRHQSGWYSFLLFWQQWRGGWTVEQLCWLWWWWVSFLTQENLLQIVSSLVRSSNAGNKIPSTRYEITFPVSPLGNSALPSSTPVCCCAGDCIYPGSAVSICLLHPESSEIEVRVRFSGKYGRQTRGAPGWGDTHSGEKSCKRNRMTYYFFVSKLCMAGDRGSLSFLFNRAGNTKSKRVIMVSELSIGYELTQPPGYCSATWHNVVAIVSTL